MEDEGDMTPATYTGPAWAFEMLIAAAQATNPHNDFDKEQLFHAAQCIERSEE